MIYLIIFIILFIFKNNVETNEEYKNLNQNFWRNKNSFKNLGEYVSTIEDLQQEKLKKQKDGFNKNYNNKRIFEYTNAYCESFNVDIHPDEYPQPKRNESIIENICGVKISDPYRWMENPNLEETKQFVYALNNQSRPFLDKSFFRDKFRKKFTHYDRMLQLFDQKSYGCISKHGDYYYYAYSEGNQKQSSIYRQKTLSDTKQLFLDPNKLSSDGTLAISQTAFSRDGSVMAYTVSEKGSDLTTIYFKDVNGQDLPDKILKVKQGSIIMDAQ
uniref:Peptidase_S9_N domain-containing protein n=1 Tax=Meloidogyne hapla TaxID=6305 RepID=A0A1I8BCK8_MELHA